MRHTLVASLLLSPMLITASAVASTPAADASATTTGRPISTGVIAPRIANPADLNIQADAFDLASSEPEQVSLALTVDEKGRPQNFRILNSHNASLNFRVVQALSRSRFVPATLDNRPISLDMNLTVVVKH